MTIKEISNGPVWILWALGALLGAMSLLLLSGHGSGLIAGFNTADEEEKERYDEKKLCHVVGGGLAVIALMLLVMAFGFDTFPSSFAFVFLGAVVIDSIVMLILANTICRK